MYPRTKTTKTTKPAATLNSGPLAGRDICRTFDGNGGYAIKAGLGSFTGPGHDETWWVSAYCGAEFLGSVTYRAAWGVKPSEAARGAVGRLIDSNPTHSDGLKAIAIKD